MKFFLSTLALLAPLALAEIVIDVPKNPVSSGSITVKWQSDPAVDPPVFQLYLFNELFHDNFGIANNVDRSLNQIDLVLPVVPASDGYTIKAVALDNVGNVYGTSADFAIGESTASTTPSSTTHTSARSSSSHSASTTGTGSQTTMITTSQTSASGFGVTRSASSTPSTDASGSASDSAGASESSGAAALGVKMSVAASYTAFAVAFVGAAIGGAVVAF